MLLIIIIISPILLLYSMTRIINYTGCMDQTAKLDNSVSIIFKLNMLTMNYCYYGNYYNYYSLSSSMHSECPTLDSDACNTNVKRAACRSLMMNNGAASLPLPCQQLLPT